MKPRFFASPASFRAWLADHHDDATELLVGVRKKESGKPSITWPEAVDAALSFGWIDGVRRRIDDDTYTIRFTPRKPGSTWSAVNIKRVAALEASGLMQPAGLEAFRRRSESKSRTYSYERSKEAELDAPLEKKLRANRKAWSFFEAQAPSYRRKVIHWITSAKSAETRLERLERLLSALSEGRRL